MYISHYVFYKVDYDENGQGTVHSVHLQTFVTQQLENSVTRMKRQEGFETLRVDENIYNIIGAVMTIQTV